MLRLACFGQSERAESNSIQYIRFAAQILAHTLGFSDSIVSYLNLTQRFAYNIFWGKARVIEKDQQDECALLIDVLYQVHCNLCDKKAMNLFGFMIGHLLPQLITFLFVSHCKILSYLGYYCTTGFHRLCVVFAVSFLQVYEFMTDDIIINYPYFLI